MLGIEPSYKIRYREQALINALTLGWKSFDVNDSLSVGIAKSASWMASIPPFLV